MTGSRLLSGALFVAVLVADAVTPLGVNVPILYLLPLLITFLTEDIPARSALTAAAAAATILGTLWDAKWTEAPLHGVVNRGLDLGVFGVALALSIRDARRTRQLRDLRRALDDSSIVAVADLTGALLHVNDRYCAISGYSREELANGAHRLVDADATTAAMAQGLWDTLRAGKVWHGDLRPRARNGSPYWVDSTIVPLLDGRGKPYQYLAIQHDASARKFAEACQQSRVALQKIGEMAAVLAHEVRNPVAGVHAGLQLFERKPALTPGERSLVREMMDRLDLLAAHVTALVHLASPRRLEMRALSVRHVLEQAVTVLRETDRWSAIAWECTGPDARVSGDAEMLQEVFTRLLVNAAEAQNGTGAVGIRVTDAGGIIAIDVTDCGSGIPSPLRARVFEPLFTTKAAASGIGLALAKQLVELHAGTLEIVSSSAHGTTMRVGLPRLT